MSLRAEQYHALRRTRDFLGRLLDSKATNVPKVVRAEAGLCLHHFPFLEESGKPMFSRDEFGPDAPPRDVDGLIEAVREAWTPDEVQK